MRKQINAITEDTALFEDFGVGRRRFKISCGKYYTSTDGGNTWKEVDKRTYTQEYDKLERRIRNLVEA